MSTKLKPPVSKEIGGFSFDKFKKNLVVNEIFAIIPVLNAITGRNINV